MVQNIQKQQMEKEKERLKKERIKLRSREYYYKRKFSIDKLQPTKTTKDLPQFKYEVGKFLIQL
jgi:hypothetical protein